MEKTRSAVCFALMMVAAGCDGGPERVWHVQKWCVLTNSTGSTSQSTARCRVDYGFVGEQVRFVVVHSMESYEPPKAQLKIMRFTAGPDAGKELCEGYVELPNAKRVDLGRSRTFFELSSTGVHSSAITFKKSQLDAYLWSLPQPPTHEGLMRFLGKK